MQNLQAMVTSKVAVERRRFLLASGLMMAGLGLSGCATQAVRKRKAAPDSSAERALIDRGEPVVALQAGARVAIVAPASAQTDVAERAAQWLEARGYIPQIMPAVHQRLAAPYDYLAGSDRARLADLHNAFADPDIAAVWCLQGGFGSWRLLDQLDYALLRQNAKPFIGYSDITALHLAIARHAGFVTFHGPMLAQDFLNGRQAPTESNLWAMLRGDVQAGDWLLPAPEASLTPLIPGHATGRLVGGNLALICSLIGTDYEIDTRGAILFFEDVNEAPARVDRMLAQLARAGKFDDAQGVLIGNFTRLLGVNTSDAVAQSLLWPIFRDYLPADTPTLAGWPSGHGNPNLILPLGARVSLDTERRGLRLEQAVVKT